jgi:hypothetical protein
MLIALTGRARSGKDTAGQFFCSTYGFTQYAFADPIRAGLRAALGLTDWHFNEGKEIVIPEYGKSPRQLMQLFGTEFGRNLIHPDIWQIRAEAALDSTKNLVITDCRFDNEAAWVREHGGYVIRITRDNAPQVSAHVSEDGVSEKLIDFKIENNGAMEDLYGSLDSVYSELIGNQHTLVVHTNC